MTNTLARRAAGAALGLVTALALGVSGCSSDGPGAVGQAAATMPGDTNEQLQQAVERAMQLSGSSQALVGVWAPWAGDYVQSLSTDDSALPVSAAFRGAQSTQPYTCALLLELVAQGELTLDRKVSADLPRQIGIDGVTYGQLCEQTSGLADFKPPLETIFSTNPTRHWPERELISEGLVASPLPFPGLDFHYSDTNAVLLGRALAVKTNRELDELLDTEVFQPTGMSRTRLPSGTTLSGETLSGSVFPLNGAQPVCDAPVPVPEVSSSMLAGAGGAVTTLEDQRAFLTSYLGGKIGGASGSAEVLETRSTANPKRNAEGEVTEEAAESAQSWGFGLLHEGPLWGREGRVTGTMSAAYQDPDSGFTVVVALNNSSSGAPFVQQLVYQLTAIVAEGQPGGLPELPWTSESAAEAVAKAAVCAPSA